MQGWRATTRHAMTRKEAQKILKDTENLFRRNLLFRNSANSRFKATKIIDQMKAFHSQRIPDSSRASQETVDIGIFVRLKNGDGKIMQSISITSRTPSKKRKWNQFWRTSSKVIPIYRKDLSWPHFDDESRAQEKQQVKEQRCCIFVFVACLTIPSSN